jgi:hypothetical protein
VALWLMYTAVSIPMREFGNVVLSTHLSGIVWLQVVAVHWKFCVASRASIADEGNSSMMRQATAERVCRASRDIICCSLTW